MFKRIYLYCLYAIFGFLISSCAATPVAPPTEIFEIPTSAETNSTSVVTDLTVAPTYTLRPTLVERTVEPSVTAAPTVASDATATATPIARNTIVPATPIRNIRLPGKPLPIDLDVLSADNIGAVTQISEVEFDASINSLAFSLDQTLLAIGLDNGAIKLWRVQDGFEGGELSGYFDSVASLAFSADGNLLAAVSPIGEIKIWQVAKGNIDWQLLHEVADDVSSNRQPTLLFEADGTLTSIADNIIRWDAEMGAALESQTIPSDVTLPTSYALSSIPDHVDTAAPQLWVGPDYTNIVSEDGTETLVTRKWSNEISANYFLVDENLVLLGDEDGLLQAIDLNDEDLEPLAKLEIGNQTISALAVNPRQTLLAVGTENTVQLFAVEP